MRKNTFAIKRSIKRIGQRALEKLRLIEREKNPGFRRFLTDDLADELYIKLSHAFPNHNIDINDFDKIVGLFNDIMNKITGRVCNDVDDFIVNYYMRLIAAKEFPPSDSNYAQVEIGVLFGGSMILMLDALKKNNCKHKIIGIDPLDGFYIRDNKDYSSDRDVVTNLPINLSTVEGNIIKCGFSPDDVMIIKDYSESKKAISAVSQYRICSIWLDGNHSYKGLKEDFNNYFPLIAPGGYILIDNYKDSHWLNRFHPGVTKFIECDLIPPTEAFQIILIHNRNFIIRKTKR